LKFNLHKLTQTYICLNFFIFLPWTIKIYLYAEIKFLITSTITFVFS